LWTDEDLGVIGDVAASGAGEDATKGEQGRRQKD
jgi:hypothetical protein